MPKGRPRIPLEQLKALGVFRPGRHAERLNEPQASGVPVKPQDLPAEVSEFWDRLIPQLLAMKTVKEIDTEAVLGACQLWVLYSKAFAQAMVVPCDKNIRSAVTGYWAAFERAAAKLGMNPADRAKLSVAPDSTPKGVEAFARKRG